MKITLTTPQLNRAIREYVDKYLQTNKNPIPCWGIMSKPVFSMTEEGYNKGWPECEVEFNYAPKDYDNDK